MFSKFIDENIEGNIPEIKFFIESILAKKNRSKIHFTKSTTPFLDDTRYYALLYLYSMYICSLFL